MIDEAFPLECCQGCESKDTSYCLGLWKGTCPPARQQKAQRLSDWKAMREIMDAEARHHWAKEAYEIVYERLDRLIKEGESG